MLIDNFAQHTKHTIEKNRHHRMQSLQDKQAAAAVPVVGCRWSSMLLSRAGGGRPDTLQRVSQEDEIE
jgi:hypothetical protein